MAGEFRAPAARLLMSRARPGAQLRDRVGAARRVRATGRSAVRRFGQAAAAQTASRFTFWLKQSSQMMVTMTAPLSSTW